MIRVLASAVLVAAVAAATGVDVVVVVLGQNVRVVAIGGIVFAAVGNGLLLTSGLAPQDCAQTSKCASARVREKENKFVGVVVVTVVVTVTVVVVDNIEFLIKILSFHHHSPSHSVAEDPVGLTIVGKKGANLLLRGRRLESGQIAQTGNGVFSRFDKVNAHVALQSFSPLLGCLVQDNDVQF